MKACTRLFNIFIIFIILFVANPAKLFADGGIHPRGGQPTERIVPTHPQLPVTLGTVFLNGEIQDGSDRVILRGQENHRVIVVTLPKDVFAPGKALDTSILPYAVATGVMVTGEQVFAESEGLRGSGIWAVGSYGNPYEGLIPEPAENRIASLTLTLREVTGNQLKVELKYIFEGRPEYRSNFHSDYSRLEFRIEEGQLVEKFKGTISGKGSLSLALAEESLDFLFQGEGLPGGQIITHHTPVPFASGQALDLGKIEEGKTKRACAKNVNFMISFGEIVQNYRGDLTMELIQKDTSNDWILANLEFDFRSRLPVQRIEIDLKTADIYSCDLMVMYTNYRMEAHYIPPVVEEDVPVLPEPEDEPTVDAEVPADEGSVEPSEPVFELGDSSMDEKNPTLIPGQNSGSEIEASVAGSGSGFLSCSFQGLGNSALDGWMILGLLGSFFPLVRRFRKK